MLPQGHPHHGLPHHGLKPPKSWVRRNFSSLKILRIFLQWLEAANTLMQGHYSCQYIMLFLGLWLSNALILLWSPDSGPSRGSYYCFLLVQESCYTICMSQLLLKTRKFRCPAATLYDYWSGSLACLFFQLCEVHFRHCIWLLLSLLGVPRSQCLGSWKFSLGQHRLVFTHCWSELVLKLPGKQDSHVLPGMCVVGVCSILSYM